MNKEIKSMKEVREEESRQTKLKKNYGGIASALSHKRGGGTPEFMRYQQTSSAAPVSLIQFKITYSPKS